MPRLDSLLCQAIATLSGKTDIDAGFEARLLLAHLLDKDPGWLIAWPEHEIPEPLAREYHQQIQRRRQGEPVAYILGYREFWGLPLKTTPATLIPRPETELLVETALELAPGKKNLAVVDLGTGSGAIAAALAFEKPDWSILATDNAESTLEIAKTNFQRLHLTVETCKSHWFETLSGRNFDLVISNPPYIKDHDPHLQQGDLVFEPASALAAGDDGLKDLENIIKNAPIHMNNKAFLILEHGFDQADAVSELFAKNGFRQIETRRDLAGLERLTLGQYHQNKP